MLPYEISILQIPNRYFSYDIQQRMIQGAEIFGKGNDSEMNREAIWKRDFIGVCMSCFFVFLTFYTLIPTLPVYAVNKFHATNTQVGLILTCFALAALISRPFAGIWMERFGKKRVLMAATGLFLVATMFYLVVGNYWLLIVLRVVHGFAFGVATSSTGTIAADVVPKKRMGEGLGYYGM
ncbi:MAG: MFS transporter, partial [Tumebacillaceae bacterium]